MKKLEAMNLVSDVVGLVHQELLAAIEQNKIPEGWDGVELRWWISDKMQNIVQNSKHPVDNRARHKDYINDRLIGGF